MHLVLYGSFAKGTQTETSDLDFAVKGCDNVREIRGKCELIPTLRTIDILDYDKCSNALLLEDIDKYGREIY